MKIEKSELHILLADDSRVVRLLISKQLAVLGLSTHVVENGERAVQEAKKREYDLIFMDVNMPVLGGKEATAQIRFFEHEAGRQPVPIIGITDFAGCMDRLHRASDLATLSNLLARENPTYLQIA